MIACSAAKKKDAGLLSARVRYDGPAFHVLRKYLRRATEPPTVLILSAKYGLIEANHAIPDYDCRITAAIAESIRADVLPDLASHLGRKQYEEVAFCVGHDYQKAVEGYETLVTSGTKVTFIPGGQGRRLRNLRAWLRRDQLTAHPGDS
ncbi:MAG: hypothetical protein K8U57_19710 [Planctomycetes bacterium]|nr:hypothetical protein [Planctomycetota bacterium]